MKFGLNCVYICGNGLTLSEIDFIPLISTGGEKLPPGAIFVPNQPILTNLARIVSDRTEIDCHCLKLKFNSFSFPVRGCSDPMDRLSPNLVWILLNGVEIELYSQKFQIPIFSLFAF